jgi:hypothetical protein
LIKLRWRVSRGIRYGRAGVRKRRTVMKFASFENVLMLATLTMFAVFLAWSVKIIVAWA